MCVSCRFACQQRTTQKKKPGGNKTPGGYPIFSQCVKELGTEEIRVTLSYCSQCDGLDPLLLRLGYPIRFTFSYILYHAGANVAFGFEKGE